MTLQLEAVRWQKKPAPARIRGEPVPDRLRRKALAMGAQSLPFSLIASSLHLGTETLRRIFEDAGIDLRARHQRLKRSLTVRPGDRLVSYQARQCVRCEWVIDTVTLGPIAIPWMYDDLCFPCWFEVQNGRAFSPANLPESYQEILAMAQQQYTIAAIETEYCGYRFRSRLEARWAVFLDALGLEWEYEKEGYRLANGLAYLPDFWLPELECWLEIKGNEPTAEERVKARLVAEGTGYPVFVFVGLPSVSDLARPTGFVAQGHEWAEGWVWQQCERCGSVAIAQGIEGCCLACHEGTITEKTRPLLAARNAARAARFEHSQAP